jgi:hypothetical protein
MIFLFRSVLSMNYLFLIAVLFFLYSDSSAQPETLWTKTFGGSNIDIGHSVEQTSDGGYVITGYTRSYGTMSGRNIWLIKTDSTGTEEWNNAFGGNNDEEAYSVQQTTDGGYILTGYTDSFGAGMKDVILLKADNLGNEVWKKTFGGVNDEEGYSVRQTADGGFIIGGVTSSFAAGGRDVWIIKTDISGNEQWRKSLGGLGSDGARCIQQTFDNGYILTGWTFSYGPGYVGNAWLVKTDTSGTIEWHKFFGGNNVDRGYCVKQTSDSGYILTGYTSSFGAGLDDMWLIKTDKSGSTQWTKTFGGTGRDYGHSVQQTADGGFIAAGYTLSYGAGGDDVFLVKTDTAGNLEWQKTYGGSSSDIGYSIQETTDGGYIITGHTLSYGAGVHDVWLIKTSNPAVPVELTGFNAEVMNGNVILSWFTASETNNSGFDIERRNEDTHYTSMGFIKGKGTTTEPQQYSFTDMNLSSGSYIYRLKQIDYDGSFQFSKTVEITVGLPAEYAVTQNYPNPFNPITTIRYTVPQLSRVKIKLFDILGNEIETLVNEMKPAGRYDITWNAAGFPSGVYFYTFVTDNYRDTRKMILMR